VHQLVYPFIQFSFRKSLNKLIAGGRRMENLHFKRNS
jgi:hypothetical protein